MSPVFWRIVDGVTWVQVYSVAQRKQLKDITDGHRVSFSVNGPWLEVWEVKRTLSWVARHLKALGECREIYGGDMP